MARTNLTDARIGASTPQDRLRHSRRQTRRLRCPGSALRPQTLLRPFPASGRPSLEDPRRRSDTMSVDEARSSAVRTLAAIRRGEDPPRDPAETLFEAVAETVFERYRRLWKPRTLDVNRCYLKNQILPRFQGRQVADIDRRDVRDWFASLRATPVAADRSMPVLSVILREAEAMGLRPEGSNPCLGIRRYRRKGRARFLSDEEIRHLSARLSAHANWASSAGRRGPPPPADGMPQERDPDAPLVRLPRGASLPPRLQDGAPHRLAVAAGPEHSRRAGPDRTVGVPGGARQRAEEQGLARRVLGHGSCRSRVARRSPARSPSHPCQHRSAAGRDRADHRQAARSPESRKPRSSTRTSPTKR